MPERRKKRKKRSASKQSGVSLFVIVILLFSAALLIVKGSGFNKPIPDVVEIPKEVQESIKNVKPQKYLRVPILLYHYVEYVKDPKDTIRKSLNLEPHAFDLEVKTLQEAGYSFITLADLADGLDDKRTLPAKSVILTFDDGYRDFYTDVFPILKKYQIKAVVFVIPNFIDRPDNLTTWMISEIIKSGLVEIGAHTMNHTYLRGLSLNQVRYEIEQSKSYLEKSFGIQVISFAYPYGAFDNGAIDEVKKAGFRTAVTTIPGTFSMDVNRFFLYRVRPGGRVGPDLLELLERTKVTSIPKNENILS
ncbi:polysaccharide deacetylase family protein [Candidatus Daviesbacteria bacterium]|nr:polysaccharide deacetylase family protein [Candidatus Daviesbacteria bacterium]